MSKDFTKRSGVVCYLRPYNYKVSLTWERRPTRSPKVSFCSYFSFRDLISSYKIKPEIEGIILFDYYICDYYKTAFVPVLMIKPFS